MSNTARHDRNPNYLVTSDPITDPGYGAVGRRVVKAYPDDKGISTRE